MPTGSEQTTKDWLRSEDLLAKLDDIERPSKGLGGKDDYERGVDWVVAEMRRWLRTQSLPVPTETRVEAAARAIFRTTPQEPDQPYVWDGDGLQLDDDVRDLYRIAARQALTAADALPETTKGERVSEQVSSIVADMCEGLEESVADEKQVVRVDRKLFGKAVCDPGSFVAREIDEETELEHESGLEPLIDWQWRALQFGASMQVKYVPARDFVGRAEPTPTLVSYCKDRIAYLEELGDEDDLTMGKLAALRGVLEDFGDDQRIPVYNARISQYEPVTVFEIDHDGEWQSYVPKSEYDRDLKEVDGELSDADRANGELLQRVERAEGLVGRIIAKVGLYASQLDTIGPAIDSNPAFTGYGGVLHEIARFLRSIRTAAPEPTTKGSGEAPWPPPTIFCDEDYAEFDRRFAPSNPDDLDAECLAFRNKMIRADEALRELQTTTEGRERWRAKATKGSGEAVVTGSEQVTMEVTENEKQALRHELSEPYGHDIRIGIFEKLRNALDASPQSPVPDGRVTVTDEMVETAVQGFADARVPSGQGAFTRRMRAALLAALNSTTHNPEEGDDDAAA